MEMLSEGVDSPDIVKEGRAVLYCLLLMVCAILGVALLCGIVFGIYELIKFLLPC